MAAVRWTRWGAVALPKTLQVRIDPVFAGRMRAGAPAPPRSLTPDEFRANLTYFASPGPRGRPVSGVVVSGIPAGDPVAGTAWIAEGLVEARRASVRHVTIHADRALLAAFGGSALEPVVDTIAVAVREAEPLRVPGATAVHAIVPLEADTVALLPEVLRTVRAAGVARIVLTWPFPGSGAEPASVVDLLPRLRAALPVLDGATWSLKGLPACAITELLPEEILGRYISRSANRWYVDAAHQRADALLFLPEVVRFTKRESCRFCALDGPCDGVAEAWLARGLVGPLLPVGRAGRST